MSKGQHQHRRQEVYKTYSICRWMFIWNPRNSVHFFCKTNGRTNERRSQHLSSVAPTKIVHLCTSTTKTSQTKSCASKAIQAFESKTALVRQFRVIRTKTKLIWFHKEETVRKLMWTLSLRNLFVHFRAFESGSIRCVCVRFNAKTNNSALNWMMSEESCS